MIGRSVARRYLSAALGAADRAGVREEMGRQLEALAELLEVQDDLQRILKHPGLSGERKLEAVDLVLGEAPVEPLRDLIELLVENDRLEVLDVGGEVYQQLVDEAEGKLRAFVTTPMPLPDEQSQRLREALSGWLEADVVIDADVDPETLGGIVVRVGDRVLDASLRGRLERISAQLTAD